MQEDIFTKLDKIEKKIEEIQSLLGLLQEKKKGPKTEWYDGEIMFREKRKALEDYLNKKEEEKPS